MFEIKLKALSMATARFFLALIILCECSSRYNTTSLPTGDLPPCDSESKWCNVPMPNISHFKFDPPTDPYRWRQAQILAKNGDHVLLSRIVKAFPNYWQFLDGSTEYRQQQRIGDAFVDIKNSDLTFLTDQPSQKNQQLMSHKEFGPIPSPYDLRDSNFSARAPIVFLGYSAFDQLKSRGDHFTGSFKKQVPYSINALITQFDQIKNKKILTPFILYHGYMNENWGFFSSYLENRTANWGECCKGDIEKKIYEILDNENLLLFVIGGHTNITHPKLLVRPLGIQDLDKRYIKGKSKKQMLWDYMRNYAANKKPKKNFVFTSIANSVSRPQLIRCIEPKFTEGELTVHRYCHDKEKVKKGTKGMCQNRIPVHKFYQRVAMSRIVLTLPGVGYDTYRLWESMYMGAMPLMERNVGFDKPLYRLPALLVDDWSSVTPDLLRSAYVEAMYRADEFDYARLNQQNWYDFLLNVSTTKSVQTVYDRYPKHVEDQNYARPKVPFNCGKDGSRCGKGTKRTPAVRC